MSEQFTTIINYFSNLLKDANVLESEFKIERIAQNPILDALPGIWKLAANHSFESEANLVIEEPTRLVLLENSLSDGEQQVLAYLNFFGELKAELLIELGELLNEHLEAAIIFNGEERSEGQVNWTDSVQRIIYGSSALESQIETVYKTQSQLNANGFEFELEVLQGLAGALGVNSVELDDCFKLSAVLEVLRDEWMAPIPDKLINWSTELATRPTEVLGDDLELDSFSEEISENKELVRELDELSQLGLKDTIEELGTVSERILENKEHPNSVAALLRLIQLEHLMVLGKPDYAERIFKYVQRLVLKSDIHDSAYPIFWGTVLSTARSLRGANRTAVFNKRFLDCVYLSLPEEQRIDAKRAVWDLI